jgi:hypothetical protein
VIVTGTGDVEKASAAALHAVEVAHEHQDHHLHVYLLNYANVLLSSSNDRKQKLIAVLRIRQEVSPT